MYQNANEAFIDENVMLIDDLFGFTVSTALIFTEIFARSQWSPPLYSHC